jgi:hypothetical protein
MKMFALVYMSVSRRGREEEKYEREKDKTQLKNPKSALQNIACFGDEISERFNLP